MQEHTVSFLIVATAFVLLAIAGGACIAKAVYTERKPARIMFTILACSTVIAFATIYAIFR